MVSMQHGGSLVFAGCMQALLAKHVWVHVMWPFAHACPGRYHAPGLQESNVETLVLGEFPESDARNFFDQVLRDEACNEQAIVSDKDWELIYAVCVLV